MVEERQRIIIESDFQHQKYVSTPSKEDIIKNGLCAATSPVCIAIGRTLSRGEKNQLVKSL